MKSQPGKQTITIHILPNISRNKGNQAVKFSQKIVYNMENIFLDGENISRLFSKKSKLSISLDQ